MDERRGALGIFTLATIAALLSSGWNNRQLLQRVSFDIVRYNSIAMDDYGPKASAVQVLREDAALLDEHARNGVPARLGLGLYRGNVCEYRCWKRSAHMCHHLLHQSLWKRSRRKSSASTACRCSIPESGRLNPPQQSCW